MEHLLKYGESISASFMILFISIAILLLGFRINKNNMLKKNIVIITCIEIGIFFILSYFMGFFVGFLTNAYSLELPTMFNNIFAPIITIICMELFRYVFISANKDSKEMMTIGTLLLFLFECAIMLKKQDLSDLITLFEVGTSMILPILCKNIVLSYLTFHAGYKPSLIYRLIMDIYVFVLPIVPDLGDYLNSMVGISMPILLYIYSSRIIDSYYNLEERIYYKQGMNWLDLPVIAVIIVLVALISGYFPYYIIGIASESMTPKINKGDAVIIKKINNEKELKEGQVIVYEKEGKKVVHRLVKTKIKKGTKYYITKGDANNANDNVVLKIDDIEGIVKMKAPLIAYPSIWFKEAIENK